VSDFEVAIVGGGFSGITVAAQLARLAPEGLSVNLFEDGAIARGAAYGTRHGEHLLNTRASAMTALVDEPDHFVRWLDGSAQSHEFVSRRRYGDYLESLATETFGHPGFKRIEARVESVEPLPQGGFSISDSQGRTYRSIYAVLAVGHASPATGFLPKSMIASDRFVADPWRFDYSAVDGDVLIIGSGLTALDAVSALRTGGHRGRIDVVSRHGRFPQTHTEFPAPYDAAPLLDASDARRLLRSFRQCLAAAANRGYDWRCVVDALRPHSESLWRRLPEAERLRFDRHLRSRWELRRHRAPQAVTEALDVYRDSGRLGVYSGTVRSYENSRVEIALSDGSAVTLEPRWIVNCTGPARGEAQFDRAPLAELHRIGALSSAASGRGVTVDGSMHPIGHDGVAVPGLFAVGPLAGGSFFESTAVPELRVQARAAAAAIVKERAAGRTGGYLWMTMPMGDLNLILSAFPDW
jgi:uncharacterized NAD(P)/FAD-binding protein YdhS